MPNPDRYPAKAMEYSDLESARVKILCVLLALRFWANYLTSLSLSFFTYKKGIGASLVAQ